MGSPSGLREYQEKSIEETQKKVDAALKNLKARKKLITYKLVAKEAGISEQTLYKSEMLKEKVKQAQAIQKNRHNKEVNSDSTKFLSEKDKKILLLNEKIEKYKEDNEKLKQINALLLGNLEKKTSETLELKNRLNAHNNIRKL